MVKKISRVFVSLLLVISCIQVDAFVKSIAVWELETEHGPTRVTVLGDWHYANSDGKKHFDTLCDAIERWDSSGTPVLFVMEGADCFKPAQKYTGNTLADLGRFMHEKKEKYKNVSFSLADKRGPIWYRLGWFYWDFLEPDWNFTGVGARSSIDFDTIAKQLLGLEEKEFKSLYEVRERLDAMPHAWNRFDIFESYLVRHHKHKDKFKTPSRDFLAEIRKTLDSYQDFIKDNHGSDYLCRAAQDLNEYCQAIKGLYEKNKHMSLIQPFLNRIREEKSFAAGTQLWDELFTPTGDLIAELGFIEEMMKNSGSYDEIVLLIGNDHAIEVNKCLEGFCEQGLAKKIKEEGIFDKNNRLRIPVKPDIVAQLLGSSLA